MKKIPTLFERDWQGDRSRVVNQLHAGCEWVVRGEGVAYKKLDGTCCRVLDGRLYKRREVKKGKPAPCGFTEVDEDPQTGKRVGWIEVGDSPEDQWYREARGTDHMPDGTYELVGPKVQGNPEHYDSHTLVRHDDRLLLQPGAPTSFAELSKWLNADIEGIVWHHPDGRMAKIKGRDFGLKRNDTAQIPAQAQRTDSENDS